MAGCPKDCQCALCNARWRFSRAVNPRLPSGKRWPYGMPYTDEIRHEISEALREYVAAREAS